MSIEQAQGAQEVDEEVTAAPEAAEAAPPLWERSKENAAPCRRGRNVRVLEASLASTQHEKDWRLQHYKSQIDNTPPNHPDPLRPWLDLLQFVQTFYNPNEPVPHELLEDCVLEFYNDPRYAHDARYINVACQYANHDAEPLEVYQSLFDHGIGTLDARFYMGWAWHAERVRDIPLAVEILDAGIHLKAHPVHQLSLWYQKLVQREQRRERQRLEQQDLGGEEDTDEPMGTTRRSRTTLGSLTASSIRRNDRSNAATGSRLLSTFTDRTGASSQSAAATAARRSGAAARNISSRNQQQQQSTSGWQIHVDVNGDEEEGEEDGLLGRMLANQRRRKEHHQQQQDREGSTATASIAGLSASAGRPAAALAAAGGALAGATTTLQRQADRRKENLPRIEAWNERGMGLVESSVGATASFKPPPFQVFVDPECAARIEEEEKKKEQELRAQQQWIRGGASGAAGADGAKKTKKKGKPTTTTTILWWDVPNSAMDTKLLLDSEGEELSLEEARARAGHYRILQLPPDVKEDEVEAPAEMDMSSSFDSSTDMNQSPDGEVGATAAGTKVLGSINDDDCVPLDDLLGLFRVGATANDDNNALSARRDTSQDRSVDEPVPQPTLPSLNLPRIPDRATTHAFHINTSLESVDAEASINTTGASLASSSAGAAALAGPSPTINTKWAMDQISVMFYSPARPTTNNHNQVSDVSYLAAGMAHAADASVVGGVDDSQDGDAYGPTGTAPKGGGGFTIFCDDEHTSSSFVGGNHSRVSPILEDSEESVPSTRVTTTTTAYKSTGFEIYQDAAEDQEETAWRGAEAEAVRKGAAGGFEIYKDEADDDDEKAPPSVAARSNSPRPSGGMPRAGTAKTSPSGFHIYCDGDEDDRSKADFDRGTPDLRESKSSAVRAMYDDGDTENYTEMLQLLADLPPAGRGHGRWSDPVVEVETQDIQSILLSPSNGLPAFGDVSCIDEVGIDDLTTSTSLRELERAVDYKRAHEQDFRGSSRRIMDRAFGAVPDPKHTLVDQLTMPGFLRNYPTTMLPQMFKLSSRVGSMGGQELRIGSCTAKVVRELGRGSYGVVSLVVDDGGGSMLAVKAQVETRMLTWEYEILEHLRDRIGSPLNGRFPQAQSMVFFADGAILGMTPALATGTMSINLIDLVNMYHTKEGLCGVPEVLALHYTAQMLLTIETLHSKGKILHCDVKPDNWLLVSVDEVGSAAPDLMLIDFGRAVDLQSLTAPSSSPYDVRLVGDASRSAEMKCVAMRHGYSWSFDVDTYGICASAHVLLFAEHMELVRVTNNKNGERYLPRKLTGKSLQDLQFKDVWHRIFDTLLNVDEATKKAIDSRPASLQMLRSQITSLLERHRHDLDGALRHQSSIVAS